MSTTRRVSFVRAGVALLSVSFIIIAALILYRTNTTRAAYPEPHSDGRNSRDLTNSENSSVSHADEGGRVRSAMGQPLPDALLWNQYKIVGKCDPKGRFSKHVLQSLSIPVAITSAGHEPLWADPETLSKRSPLEITLRPQVTAKGRVLDRETHAPVAGVTLAVSTEDFLPLFAVTSSAAGEWTAPIMRDQALVIHPLPDERSWYWPAFRLPNALSFDPSKPNDIFIREAPVVSDLLVKVSSPEGTPIPNAIVHVESQVLRTNKDGLLRATFPRSGLTNVSAISKGYTLTSTTVDLDPGTLNRVVLTLSKGDALIFGEAKTHSPHLKISRVELRDLLGGILSSTDQVDAAYSLRAPSNRELHVLAYLTSEEGDVQLIASPFVSKSSITLHSGQEYKYDLQLPQYHKLNVSVYDPSGRSATLTRVHLERTTAHPDAGKIHGRFPAPGSIVLDDSGKMTALLTADSWSITATHADFKPLKSVVSVANDSSSVRLSFLPAFSVSGKVTYRDGRPVKSVHVRIPSEGEGAVTGPKGEFVIRKIPPGSHVISVTEPGRDVTVTLLQSSIVVGQDTRDILLTLPTASGIEGVVVKPSSSPPISHITVACKGPLASYSSKCNDQGEFKLTNLPPGEYTYHVTVGFTEGKQLRTGRGSISLPEGSTIPLTLSIPDCAEVSILVSSDGELPRRLSVEFLGSGDLVQTETIQVTATTASIERKFILQVGNYTVSVRGSVGNVQLRGSANLTAGGMQSKAVVALAQ